jgi:hypothetical protein
VPTLKLACKSLKCNAVIDPAQLAGSVVLDGSGPVAFVLAAGESTLIDQFNAKSLRRAAKAAAEGAAKAIIIQGNLVNGRIIENAGISVPPPPALREPQDNVPAAAK